MAENPGKPVQILNFRISKDKEGKRMSKIELDEDVLKRVFSKGGDRPIILISIAGPSRKGKSFFLGFVLRYLESLSNGNPDWIGYENQDTPLEGFQWGGGYEIQTTGMWIWSKPYFVKAGGTKECAVFLMDTQGVFDEHTDQHDWCSIIGLSILTSCCTILNMTDFLEDSLLMMNNFMEYGLLANDGRDSDIKAFQKLLILLRDWNHPDQFPYGEIGGRNFLKAKLTLDGKDSMPTESRKVRLNLKKCFENIDCYLLPQPGEKATDNPKFNGAIEFLDKAFSRNIEKCIELHLSPDELKVKTIGGIEMTSKNFGSYFKMYVDIFNSEDTPKPITMHEATLHLTNQELIRKLLLQYKKKLNKIPKNDYGFIPKADLTQFHKKILDATLNSYKVAVKLGNPTIWGKYSNDIMSQAETEFEEILAKTNSRLVKICKDEIDSFLESYENGLNKHISENCFLEDGEFQIHSDQTKKDIIASFENIFGAEDTDVISPLLEELKSSLSKAEHNLASFNFLEKSNAKKQNQELLQITLKKYEDSLHNDSILTLEDLEKIHLNSRKQMLLEFQQDKNHRGNAAMLAMFYSKCEESIDEKFKTTLIELTQSIERAQNQISLLIGELTTLFGNQMQEKFEDFNNEAELDEAVADLSSTNRRDFIEKTKAFRLGEEDKASLTSDYDKKILLIQGKIREKFLAKRKADQELIEAKQSQAAQEYEKTLSNFINQTTIPSETSFEDYILKQKDEMLQVFQEPKHQQELLTKFEKISDKLREELTSKINRSKSTAKNLVVEAKEYYQRTLLPYVTEYDSLPKNEDELREIHSKIIETAKKKFLDNGFSPDDSFVQPFLEEIENESNTIFDHFLKLFESKKEEIDGRLKEQRELAFKYYSEEMEKHIRNEASFYEPKEFETFNQTARLNALKKANPKGSQEESELIKIFEQLYIEFKHRNDMNTPTNPAIGIDLGTTYSCVAVYLNGKVHVIPNGGYNTTPSYVCYKENNVKLVGVPAKRESHVEPENTIYDAKRLIGLPFNHPSVQNDISHWPFEVIEEREIPKIHVRGKTYHPEQISAEVLKQLKDSAEGYLKCPVKNAVITVPAYFTDGQKQATMDAGKIAGLNVLKIVPEPTAAAVAYRSQQKKSIASDTAERKVLIYDLGGGTFDVAVLTVRGSEITCKAIGGDTHLGGEDFDQNLVDYCIEEHLKATGIDLSKGKFSTNKKEQHQAHGTMRRIRNLCEERKRDLSSGNQVDIIIDAVHGTTDLHVNITRRTFEELNQYLFDKTINCVEKVLLDANMKKSEIDDVVLVGGSTRIPKVQEMLTDHFEGKALNKAVHQDEAVAHGAAILAAVINGGIACESGEYTKLTDITPRSLGVEVYGGGFDIIIPKSTKTPNVQKEIYKTAHNNQTSVEIVVYEGENPIAVKNQLLGKFYLNGIPPNNAGVEEIQVDMNINEQGILHVAAVCKSTGKQKDLTIREHKLRLSKAAIQKILEEEKES